MAGDGATTLPIGPVTRVKWREVRIPDDGASEEAIRRLIEKRTSYFLRLQVVRALGWSSERSSSSGSCSSVVRWRATIDRP